LSVKQWWASGRQNHLQSQELSPSDEKLNITPVPHHKTSSVASTHCLPPHVPTPQVIAADPFTSVAYADRTSLTCASLSFRDIADGALPPLQTTTYQSPDSNAGDTLLDPTNIVIDMVICSFALHLVNNPSELFALLWELSTKTRWLIILAPHKKPEIKDGWGWTKWNVNTWKECLMSDNVGQYLKDRVHCRIYRSVNI